MGTRAEERWARLRYGGLLPLAARGRAPGRAYARLVGQVEWRRDPVRRALAVRRIAGSLDLPPARAGATFLRSLVSEAREEADTARFIRCGLPDATAFHTPLGAPRAGRTIFAILHLGSPIVSFLYLRRVAALDIRLIGRRLDDANPMPAAKQAWGARKVAWVEHVSGAPFLDVDARSIAAAREHLLAGGSICAAVDVPGNVVSRSMRLCVLGSDLLLSSGVLSLARLSGASLRGIVAVPRRRGFDVLLGDEIPVQDDAAARAGVAAWMDATLRRLPGEWWLWPYVAVAPGGRAAPGWAE